MLHLQQYKKAYGPEPVLAIGDWWLDEGLYWIKGENGAGKTTLLKSIAGLIPFEGTIEVVGISLRKQRLLYTKAVAFAEAEPLYPSFLSGQELISFYLQTKGGDPLAAHQMAEALSLAPYLKKTVGTYSSGMQKKLSLLLAFVGKPKLILLDEPFVTLDAEAVNVLRKIIGQHSKNAVSFLISSHQELVLDVPYKSLQIHNKTIERETYATGA